MKKIVHLNEKECKERRLVGGKVFNLAVLSENKINVPKGFCLTTAFFDGILEEVNLKEKFDTLLEGASYEELKRAILSVDFPDDSRRAISLSLEKLKGSLFAVRSSGIYEDLPTASFAGIHDSFLGVNRDNLIEKVKECWISLWSRRAVDYRKKNNIADKEARIAVLIQELVPAVSSGVVFTKQPNTDYIFQQLIESSWGFGEMVVSGSVDVDRFLTYKFSPFILERKIAHKQQEMVIDKGQIVRKKIHWPRSKKPSLTPKQVYILSDVCVNIENIFGYPQDIEWSFSKDGLNILQSRPITII